jgi:fermentation-respiration switch protein FrsA (DUF1100 family)
MRRHPKTKPKWEFPRLCRGGSKSLTYPGVAAPRSANGGAPIATNSSSSQPAPTPTMSRPPDITSMVASIFAVSTAGRCGATITEVRNFAGDLLLPADIKPGERRAGIVLCHGYTGVRSIYLPENARVLAEAGYVVLSFDYKGWGDSDGVKTRLAPYSRVADVQAALTFMGAQPEADAARLGIYGTSYGGRDRGVRRPH